MRPRVGDSLIYADGKEWLVVAVETAEEAIEGTRPTQRAGEASRIGAAMGSDWRARYWKVTVRRKNGIGTRVVDSMEADMKKIRVVSGHIEV